MTSIIRLQDVLPKSVLSYYRGKGLNGNRQCPPFGDWRIKNNSQIAKVIQKLEPRNGRCFYETKEKYMVWIPGEIALTSGNNGGTDNTSHKSPLVTENSVTLAVDSILNVDSKLLTDDEVQIQSSLIRVKRRYPVEISVPRPSTGTGMSGGGDAKSMGVIHTTLLMVTAHCQLHIQIPGKEAVKVPSTDDILKYGDGRSSKLQHTTSVDSGYGIPGSPDIGGGEGRNFSEPGDRQEQRPFFHTNSRCESISADGDDVPHMSAQNSVVPGLGDGTSLSEQATANLSEQTISEVIKGTPADNDKERMTTSHAVQVAEESNATSFPGSGIVDVLKPSGDGMENQPFEADGAKLKHSRSVESGYESAASLCSGFGDGASLSSQAKDAGDSKVQTMSHNIQVAKEFDADVTTDVTSSGSENRVTEGVPEPKKPGDVIDKELVQASGAEGDNYAVGLLGVGQLENAAMFRVQQEHIREEFHKVDIVDQLARGELGEGVIGRSVPVESGNKDVDATVNSEKLKKEDSQDEGYRDEEIGDLHESVEDFERYDCCDVLFAVWKDKAKDCPDALRYFEEFYNEFSKGKDFVIKTFDDFHAYGVDVVCEAAHRASKIMVFVAPKCSDCPCCSLKGKEAPVAYREKLFKQLTADLANWKNQRILVTVIPKLRKRISVSELFQGKSDSELKAAPRLKDRDAKELLKEDMIQQIIEKREKTVELARQHVEKQKRKRHESQEIELSLSLPLQRSSSNEKNGSPDSGIGSIDFELDERKDVLILCHDDDVDSTRQLQARIREAGQSLRIGTQESFHHLGLEKRQGAIENSDKVIIYASRRYALDTRMIKALDWEKAITDIGDKLVVVVPKGTSQMDYDEYKMNLNLMSAAATYFEDKTTDMEPLADWFSPKDQAKFCSYG